ncbi:hypothetical protein ACJ73_07553 [Blastomyces percursus]|uniref:Uncharacterized protein n=1 Tax=Blastomyces percursus TaxID=1658174 RepID=A0A1J9PYY4_9EURO|nr:hypothetical protein ACJ73_07553 [Blastomyces percursus]
MTVTSSKVRRRGIPDDRDRVGDNTALDGPSPTSPDCPSSPVDREGQQSRASNRSQAKTCTSRPSSSPTPSLAGPQNPPSQYLYAFEMLTKIYGERSAFRLKSSNIIKAIKAGDALVRDDAVDFLRLYCSEWQNPEAWRQQVMDMPQTSESNLAKFLQLSRCAESILSCSKIDRVKLRMTQLLLYHYYRLFYEEMKDSKEAGSKTRSTLTIDFLLRQLNLEEWEQMNEAKRARCRASFHSHKRMGKRWSILVAYLGCGLLLICSNEVVKLMYVVAHDSFNAS